MRVRLVIFITASTLLLFFAVLTGYHVLAKPTGELANVIKIVDGDTFEIENGQTVRTLGINTPEKNEFYYKQATDKLNELIGGKQVRLEKGPDDVDKYGRILRYVFVDKEFVNLEMLRGGYAVVHIVNPDEDHFLDFKKGEKEARDNKLGIWKISSNGCIGVTEFVYDAVGNDNQNLNGEYIRLANLCDKSIDMDGWTVRDNSASNSYTFHQFSLKSNSSVTLYSGNGDDSTTELYWKNRYGVWNNDGDTMFLRDRNGNLIATYSYPN